MNSRHRLSIVHYPGDPLSGLIRLLRPSTTLWARIDAWGQWGVSFERRNDLLFCWVERGECMLLRPGAEPLLLREGDFTFVRTSTPFAFASDPAVVPIQSDRLIADQGPQGMSLGADGDGAHTILRGGRFVFDTANEALLFDMLPQVMALSASDQGSSPHVRTLLQMNEEESRRPGPGSHMFVGNLMELILLAALRQIAGDMHPQQTGLLAGLADPKLAQAIIAIHDAPSYPWSIGALARLCGLSRSGFAQRFSAVMGIGVIGYVQQWRMAMAKDALQSSGSPISEIALTIGFQSSSAFSSAFTRMVGCSPKQFRNVGSG